MTCTRHNNFFNFYQVTKADQLKRDQISVTAIKPRDPVVVFNIFPFSVFGGIIKSFIFSVMKVKGNMAI